MRYRYRIEPTPTQQRWLARVFGCCRVVFNDALRVRDDAYQAGMKLSDSEIQRRVITQAKTTVERGWLAEVPSVALVQSVDNSRRAELLRLTLRQAAGWRGWSATHEIQEGSSSVVSAHAQRIPDPAEWAVVCREGRRGAGPLSRELPTEPSSVTIIRKPDGHYYASFVVDVESTPCRGARAG